MSVPFEECDPTTFPKSLKKTNKSKVEDSYKYNKKANSFIC